MFCSDRCANTIYELQPLTYATDQDGNLKEDQFTIDPHTLSALWYALDDYEVTDLKAEPEVRNGRTGKGR
ncbi:terminase large subunit [Bacillus licheniformis]|nr:terminase large subunit [Bacillus licheniformis]